MIADDLFAGAGGWDLAAAELGIHARGVENMKEARATREAAGLTTIHDDVWTFQPDGQATGLIASPPCQTFSQAGKGTGRKALDDVLRGIRDGYVNDLDHLRFLGLEVGDERTSLVLTPLHFALTGGYDWLAWEQVPGVLPVWEACADHLRSRGWNVWTGKLHSEQYGVPQTRTRAFLLASRHGTIETPTPTHSRYYPSNPGKLDAGAQRWVSIADALGWEPGDGLRSNYNGWELDAAGNRLRAVRSALEPASTITSKAAHYVPGEPPEFLRMTKMPNSAQRNVDQPAPTIAFGHDAASARWFTPVYCGAGATSEATAGQMPRQLDEPAHTVTGGGSAALRWGTTDEYETRRITVAEAAVLQSFPADHPFAGGKGKQYLQVGNAVPPGLALAALTAASGKALEEAA